MKVFQNNKWHDISHSELMRMVEETIAEIGGEKVVNELIRKEKVTLIEDIIRVKKLSGCISRQHLIDINYENIPATFDLLYDQDIEALELQLARLSAELSKYMQAQVLKHNNSDNGWLHLDLR